MAHVATADVAGGNGKKKNTPANNIDRGAHENSAYWSTRNTGTGSGSSSGGSSGRSGGGSGGGGGAAAPAIDYAAQLAAALDSMYSSNMGRLNDYLSVGRSGYEENVGRLNELKGVGTSTRDKSLGNIDKWESVGNANYKANINEINNLKGQGLANYKQSDLNINDYYNQGKSAYDKNMQRINDAYGASNDYLTRAYQKALENLAQNYDYQRQVANEDAEAAKREAYINSRLQSNNLAQSLAAMGITGGASESTRAKVANALQNSVNEINSTTSRNIANIGQTYNTNLSNMEQARLNSLAEAETQKAQLLNAIEDTLTGLTGNVTSMRNSLNDSRTNFLSQITNALNTARDNYTTFTGNVTNSRNSVLQAFADFMTNWTNASNNNRNAYTDFYGNYTNMANQLAEAYANQQYNYYRDYGSLPSFNSGAMNRAYNAARSMSNITAPAVAAYRAAATSGINPAVLAQTISQPALDALAAAQQQVDTSGFNDIQFINPEDWSSYIAEVAQLQNLYNPQDVEQATPETNARQYQRWLAQSQAQAAGGANAQAIANNLVQSGVTNQNTLQQILAQLGL